MNSVQFTLQESDYKGDSLLVVPLCFASFFSSFSFISSYTAYITVPQLNQLRGNRGPEKQKEAGLGVCLSVARMRLQRTHNSSNMVNVGHGKQKPSLKVCGLRAYCYCLASCSVCVKASDLFTALSVRCLAFMSGLIFGLGLFCSSCGAWQNMAMSMCVGT